VVKKKKRKESEKTRRMERPVKKVQFGGRYLEPVFSSFFKKILLIFFFLLFFRLNLFAFFS